MTVTGIHYEYTCVTPRVASRTQVEGATVSLT